MSIESKNSVEHYNCVKHNLETYLDWSKLVYFCDKNIFGIFNLE